MHRDLFITYTNVNNFLQNASGLVSLLSNTADCGDDDQRMRMIAAAKMLANATAAMVAAAKVFICLIFTVLCGKLEIFFNFMALFNVLLLP